MSAHRWSMAFTAALLATACAVPASAQSWNLYSGTTSYYVPFWDFDTQTKSYVKTEMAPDQAPKIPLSLNGGDIALFTMDTGSTGLVASKNHFPVDGLTPLGPGHITYTSSGDKLVGDFYLTKVNIYDNPTADKANPLTTASVVALRAVKGECEFTDKGCHPTDNPEITYMGIGFDRTPVGGAYGNPNTFTAIDGPASYSPGYIITNSGVHLGLTNALTADYAFVKLMPKVSGGGPPDWLGAPVTVAVGGATGSGGILPDTGINYAFLTAPAGAVLPSSPCPGGTCLAAGVPVQIFLPGQSSPQIAFYTFTTGGHDNALQPDHVQIMDGPSVFLNTGRDFYAGFNYFYDPVNGFVGYQWNGTVPDQYGFVIPIAALKGDVSLPALLSSTLPTYLMGDTTVSSPGTVVFQGSVFGPGGLTIAAGDFSLTGAANTYQGGTTVAGGSLSLGPGATLPSASALTVNGGAFNLNGNTQVLGSLGGTGGTIDPGNGLLVLDTAQANTLASKITGTGMFTVQGGGSLDLTGDSSGFSGQTVVADAGLFINGSLGGTVFAGPGGVIGGTGTVAGNLYNGGILSPGNSSVGTLNVAGNFNNSAAGQLMAEVTGAGLADRLAVTGAASLQGGSVFVSVLPGAKLAPSTTFTILSATGGLSGTFASVNEPYPFLQSSLNYDATNAYLTLTVGGFAAAGTTPTQSAVGAVLDANVRSATGDFAQVLSALAMNVTSSGQAQTVLQSISGNNYAAFGSTMVAGAQLFMNNFADQAGGGGSPVSTRVALAEACAVVCDVPSPAPWSAWAAALGGLGTIGANAGTGSVTYNAGGVAVGLDRLVAPNFRAGITAGYTSGSQWVGGFNGKGTSDTFLAGLYGNYRQGAVYADGIAGYAYSYNQMWRGIALPGLQQRTARGSTGANQFYGQIEGGYRFDIGTAADAHVTPFVRLQGYTGTQDGFSETGAQSLDLSIASQTTNSVRSVIGGRLGGAMDLGWRDKLAVQFRLGWSHEYASTARPVTATLAGAPLMPFTTYGVAPTRDAAVLGFSANTAIAEATSLYLRYEGNVSGQDSSHALTAGARMTW